MRVALKHNTLVWLALSGALLLAPVAGLAQENVPQATRESGAARTSGEAFPDVPPLAPLDRDLIPPAEKAAEAPPLSRQAPAPVAEAFPEIPPLQQLDPELTAPPVSRRAIAPELPPAAAPLQRSAVPEPPRASPIADALREILSASVAVPPPRDSAGRARHDEHKAIVDFYEARGFEPLWRDGERWSPAAASAIGRIQRAREDALDLRAIRIPALDSASPRAIAAADFALSQAAAAYGRQASGSRIRPGSLTPLITAKAEVARASDILAKVPVAGGNAGDVLHAYNPPHDGYRALRAKLAEIRGTLPKPADTPVAIAPGPVLRVGMSDQRVPLIRARFGLTPNEPNIDPHLYDVRVAGAVAEFQRSKGIRANGMLTPQTIAALSGHAAAAAPGHVEAEIIANMERWRWLPRDLGKMHLMVNVPEYMVRVNRDGQQIHETRVIVGAQKTPSPVFSDTMQFLIVNPSWNVPPSIIKEMGGPEAMAAKGFEVRQTRHGPAVRQPPGPRNALGNIKFMFPNDHAVYLHDTPGRHLFSAARRAMSHGCIRVHEPFRLAEVVMSTAPGWSEKRLRSMVGSGERTLHMPEKLPIHIAYFTAFVDGNGQLQQREDIYGYSRLVQRALGS